MGRPANPTTGFGGVLRRLRLDRKLTQAQLARIVGLTPAYIARVETDPGTRPSQAVIQRLAQALAVSEAVLMEAGGRVPPEVTRACLQTPAEMLWFARLPVAERRRLAQKKIDDDAHLQNERRVRALARRLRNV
jgi:transcriptional regulator with XRE-family HTH domain